MNEDDGRKSELQDDNATADGSNGEPVDEQDEERVTARFVSNMMNQNLLDNLIQTASIVRVEHRRKGQTDSTVFLVVSLSTHEQVNSEHLWSLCLDHPLSLSRLDFVSSAIVSATTVHSATSFSSAFYSRVYRWALKIRWIQIRFEIRYTFDSSSKK